MLQQGGARTSGQGGGWVSRPKYDRRAAELKDGIMVKLTLPRLCEVPSEGLLEDVNAALRRALLRPSPRLTS